MGGGLVSIAPGMTVSVQHADRFKGFLDDLNASGYGVDPKQSGGYNYRTIDGTNKLSNHAFGNAVDVNWDRNARGTKGDIPADLARSLAAKHGLVWGGDWKNPDPMHFEVAGASSSVPHVHTSQSPPMALGGPSPTAAGSQAMATDYAGNYVPDELIRMQQQQGQQYWNTRPSGGKFSLAEGLLSGLGSTINNVQAADAIRNNQRVRSAALSGGPTLASLLQSGIPEYQDMAAKAMIQQQNPAAQIELERARVALDQAREMGPMQRDKMAFDLQTTREEAPLKRELLRAQTEQAKTKDELSGAVAGIVKGALAPPSQPAPPPPKPIGEIIPQSFDGDAPMPGIIKTAEGAAPAPAQASQPKAPDSILANVPPDQRRKVGEAMLLNPTTKALGEQLLKDADKGDLEKASRTELEKKMLGNVDHLARLGEIEKAFKPDYLTFKFRAGQKINALGEVLGQKLKPEEQQRLAEYTAFRSDVARNFNQLLKEASGTAVTESEYKRMQLQEPTAGDGGWFDHHDSPTEFQAKLKQSTMALKLAIARQTFLRNRGGDPAEIAKLVQSGGIEGRLPLGGMKKIIDNGLAGEQKRLLQANPNMPPDELTARLRDFGKREYGI